MLLKITKSAYQLIEKESLRCSTETGGLLEGTLKLPIVILASNAGNSAHVSAVFYSNDSVYDNQHLHKTIKKFSGKVKLIGYWHKHPGKMSHLSSMDIETARGIVKRAEEEGDTRPVFFMITNVTGNDVKLYCYVLNDRYKVEPIAIEIIDDNSSEVEKALSIEPTIVQPKKMDFWNEPGFQFYLTKTGYARLQQEVDELKAHGFAVKAYAKGLVYLTISKHKETLICMIPTEYPLNPPRFFRGKDEIKYSLPVWNSSFRIIDILQNLEELTIERKVYESHNNKTGSKFFTLIGKIKRAIKSLWFG